MGCIKKNVLQNGDISYRIQVKAKNLRTGKFEAKVMTWRKPAELTERQCEKELKRLELNLKISLESSLMATLWLMILSLLWNMHTSGLKQLK